MKKKIASLIVLLSLALVFSCISTLQAADKEDIDILLSDRQTDCWVEGELFGDLVLGAR